MPMCDAKKCNECTDLSKFPAGFLNEEGEVTDRKTDNILYDCTNLLCPVKIERIRQKDEKIRIQREIKKVKELNLSNGIDVDLLVKKRKECRLKSVAAAKLLGISASDYSDMEHYIKPVPIELFEEAMQKFQKAGNDWGI